MPGSEIIVRAALFNGKVGHAFPSGSTEERVVWLEVRGVDEQGRTFHIPVDRKGFEGEAYTIADPKAIAYQAMGEIMEVKGYQGISRDGDLPEGARIFRRPFFDPKGRMTICQWYTAENTDIDYRFAPMETKFETYTWSLPEDLSDQEVKITATLYYSLVPSSVGKFMGLPAYAYEPRLVNRASAVLNVK